MKLFFVYGVLLTLLVSLPRSTGEVNLIRKKSNNHFNIFDHCRKKRDVDEEDVINRFEMERVSPLYDILRNLPAFEDGWIHNQITSPIFTSPPSFRLKNESSSYGEFKIELSKDEEHVVSESGKQFHENSALNWYYSAESYSSVNNYSSSNINKYQYQTTSPKTTKLDEVFTSIKPTNLDEMISPKTTKLSAKIVSPKTTKLPAKLVSPETTKLPANIVSPKTTKLPAKIASPKTTKLPAKLVSPKTTKLPANIVSPKTTKLPAKIASPKTTNLPTTLSPRTTVLDSGLINIFTDKPVISRKLDEEHVVSHVPSLKGGRGAFLDFNLLEASTTPRMEATSLSKTEDFKPNITTRYILLQSGRVVAINVTSVAPVLKPSHSLGSSKNPNLPTFYFGNRIRNKNSTNVPLITTTPKNQGILSTPKTLKSETTTQASTKYFSDFMKLNPQKDNLITTARLQIEVKTLTTLPPRGIKSSILPFLIKPNVEYTHLQQLKNNPLAMSFHLKQNNESYTTQIVPTTTYENKIKTTQNLERNKSLLQRDLQTTTKSHQIKEPVLTTKGPPIVFKETSTLDPAQKWWNEMKAAKRKNIFLVPTTLKPNVSTVSSRSVLQSLLDVFKPTTIHDTNKNYFDASKSSKEENPQNPNVELAANARSGKSRTIDVYALHFSTTTAKPKTTSTSVIHKISTRPWNTLDNFEVNARRRHDTLTTVTDEDILEPSVPLTDFKHEFVRIVTLPPPVTQSADVKPLHPSTPPSRRPRYRGLSHVNLPSPLSHQVESSTVKLKQQVSPLSLLQVTTVSPRRPSSHQTLQRWNTLPPSTPSTQIVPTIASPPLRRSRNGFYLRNSVSFQTIPPGSLTDRRTLTSEEPVEASTSVKNLQPLLEDLLIISFEPTRKSMREFINTTEIPIQTTVKAKNQRGTAKYHNSNSPKKEKHILTTAKPPRKVTENSFLEVHARNNPPPQSDNRNRVGRNFRLNNSRLQGLPDGAESTSSPATTTKKAFRVYYFEPKRKKSKKADESLKSESPKPTPGYQEQPRRSSPQRVQTVLNRGDSTSVVKNNNFPHQDRRQYYENPTNFRSPKQIRLSSGDRTSTTEAATTPKPAVKRFRGSPFIWHRPNVGTHKSVLQEDASVNSDGSIKNNGGINDGIYRPTRTG